MASPKHFRLSAAVPEADLQIVGMAATLRDYQMGVLLNQTLGADFCRLDDLEIELPRQQHRICFSCFYYDDEELHLIYHLLANKNGHELLVPEYRQADFLLCLQGPSAAAHQAYVLDRLKNHPQLQLVFPVDLRRIRHKDRLIFDCPY